MTFFTADQHFCHRRIILLQNREFADVDAMNAEMIRRWNSVVEEGDLVYCLGDFGLGGVPALREVLRELRGHIVLVRGSHDGTRTRCERIGFKAVVDKAIELEDGTLCTHVPPYQTEDRVVLCGHVHSRWVALGNMINVGVDVWDYTPVTLRQVLADKRVKELRGLWMERNFGRKHGP